MELTFLGTSSAIPTARRGLTGLGVRSGPVWDLFDCGEGTQDRVRDKGLTLPRLRRIYISHLHGDHCFGLPGLLTSRSMTGVDIALDLFGPEGLEEMVTTVLELSASHMSFPLRFHTLPESGGVVVDDEGGTVTAIPLSHRVPSFGWWIVEPQRPGLFAPARAGALGVPEGPMFGALQSGSPVRLADGTVVDPSQVLGPPRQGRRVVIAGDNSDPAGLLERTGSLDLLVHEATFTERVLGDLADDRGHSTAARVARAAEDAGVANLILTHFSARFDGDDSIEEVRAEASGRYRGRLELAEDDAVFELTLDAELIRRQPAR